MGSFIFYLYFSSHPIKLNQRSSKYSRPTKYQSRSCQIVICCDILMLHNVISAKPTCLCLNMDKPPDSSVELEDLRPGPTYLIIEIDNLN